uniref:Lipoprotein n=1 Tax=Strongyloides stercoralis TaxID=6248 RepID=A0A0K0EHP2_STRER
MKIILNFCFVFILAVFCNSETIKNVDEVVKDSRKSLTSEIAKINVTKFANSSNEDRNSINTTTKYNVELTNSNNKIYTDNTTKNAGNKLINLNVTSLNLSNATSSINYKKNEMSSMLRRSTKLPIINRGEIKNLSDYSGNNNVEILSGKEVTFMQYLNGKQINVARKTNQILFGHGNEKNDKMKIDEISQYLATEKPAVAMHVDDIVKKELDTFVTTIDCYRKISKTKQNSTNLSCLQNIDISKSSIVKKVEVTKQNNTKLYGGISNLKFTFLDKGNSFEVAYEILKV